LILSHTEEQEKESEEAEIEKMEKEVERMELLNRFLIKSEDS
jgi:hypothetical protein